MPVSEYTPGIDDVGDLLRARTFTTGGQELGTFTEETRPTDQQVLGIIEKAAGTVFLSIGDDIPAALFSEAKHAVTLLTAMMIELSFYPEQVAAQKSAYAEYKELYEELIGTREEPGSLVLAVINAAEDGTVDVVTHLPKPTGTFPPTKELIW